MVSLVSIANEFVGFFKWSDVALKIFNPDVDINPYISSLALLMVIIICIFLMSLEFYRRRAKTAKIHSVKSGKAMITLESVAGQIRDTVINVEGLEDVKVNVYPKSNGIIISMQAKLNQDVNIPEKMQEIINEAKDVASKKLGIKVLKSNLTITNLIPGKVVKAERVEEVRGVPEEGTETMSYESSEEQTERENQ